VTSVPVRLICEPISAKTSEIRGARERGWGRGDGREESAATMMMMMMMMMMIENRQKWLFMGVFRSTYERPVWKKDYMAGDRTKESDSYCF
jgi:hypothetical protein